MQGMIRTLPIIGFLGFASALMAEDPLADAVDRLDGVYATEREEAAASLAAAGAAAEPVLRDGLHHTVGRIRESCARLLGNVATASSAEALLEAVEDPEPDVRFAARRSLIQISQVIDLPQARSVIAGEVRRLLEDLKDPDRALAAAVTLAGLGRLAEPLLLEEALDRSSPVRREALHRLKPQASTRSMRRLLSLLKDPDPAFQAEVRAFLASLGPGTLTAVREAKSEGELAGPEAESLVDLFLKDAVEWQLAESFARSEGRGFCVGQFREIKALSPDAAAFVLRIVREPDYPFGPNVNPGIRGQIRDMSVPALADIGHPDALSALRARLAAKSDDFDVKLAMYRLGDPGPIQEIRRQYQDKIEKFRSENDRKGGEMPVLRDLAMLEYKVGEYARAEESFRSILRASPAGSFDGNFWHNFAGVLALQGKKEEALEGFGKAVRSGEVPSRWARVDRDFESLCGDPRYEALLRMAEQMEGRR